MTERPLTRDIFGIASLDPKERISLCQRAERMGEMFMCAVVLSYEDTVLKAEAERDKFRRVVEMIDSYKGRDDAIQTYRQLAEDAWDEPDEGFHNWPSYYRGMADALEAAPSTAPLPGVFDAEGPAGSLEAEYRLPPKKKPDAQ